MKGMVWLAGAAKPEVKALQRVQYVPEQFGHA